MSENHQHESQEELNDQLLVRREKMQEMTEANVNPFAAGFERTHLSQEIIEAYDHLEDRKSVV